MLHEIGPGQRSDSRPCFRIQCATDRIHNGVVSRCGALHREHLAIQIFTADWSGVLDLKISLRGKRQRYPRPMNGIAVAITVMN
jgi:hypothetical protein